MGVLVVERHVNTGVMRVHVLLCMCFCVLVCSHLHFTLYTHEQRDMIAKALKMKRASAEEMTKMLMPTEAALNRLERLKTAGCDEHENFRNHLQLLCGACSALGW